MVRFSRRLALSLLPLALVLAPALALAQAASSIVTEPAAQLDFIALVNAIPLPATLKAIVLFAFPLVYGLCAFLRAWTSPTSPLGRVVRFVLDGVKHPDEKPAAAVAVQGP